MPAFRHLAVLALACLPLLGACEGRHQGTPASNAAASPSTAQKVSKVDADVRAELAEGNITISDDDARLPKAEITPRGDLLIGGDRIDTNVSQRTLLLRYREQVIGIAAAGSAIGIRGADLGMQAAGEAMKGMFTGNTDALEQRVEGQAQAIKDEAMKICDRLPEMRTTQQALADALPAFKPYATMDQSDIDDCRKQD